LCRCSFLPRLPRGLRRTPYDASLPDDETDEDLELTSHKWWVPCAGCLDVVLHLYEKLATLAECPRELLCVYLIKSGESFAYFSFSFILVIWLSEEYGLDDKQAGWLYGLYGMLTSLMGILVGVAVDNMGVRISLLIGMTVLATSRGLLCFVYSVRMAVAVLLVGLPLGTALGIPVLTLGIRRYTTDRTRAFAYSVYYVVMNISACLAGISADLVRKTFKEGLTVHVPYVLNTHLTNYRVLLLIGTLASFANLCVAFFVREINVIDHNEPVVAFKPKTASAWSIFWEVVRQGSFWRFVTLMTLFVGVRMVFRHMDATLPKYLTRVHGEDAPYGILISINPTLIFFLVPLVTVLAERWSVAAVHLLQVDM